jgi:hypothetical protein
MEIIFANRKNRCFSITNERHLSILMKDMFEIAFNTIERALRQAIFRPPNKAQ